MMTISSGGAGNTTGKTPTATLTIDTAKRRYQAPISLKGTISSSGMSSKISFSGGMNIAGG
jgi:hypothetical protein